MADVPRRLERTTRRPPSSPDAEPGSGTLLAYALAALPLATLTLPFYVVVPTFYAHAGLPIAIVGQALLAVRILDAVLDPAIGVLADQFRPAFGRRRVWMIASASVVAIAAVMVFVPPLPPTALHLTLWGAVLSIGYTAAWVPYAAWGAELSRSYGGRTRVVAFREALTVIGTLVALLIPALLPLAGLSGERQALIALAALIALMLPVAALVAARRVPEPVERTRRPIGFVKGLTFMRQNGPFVRLILAFFINGLANGLPATLYLLFVSDRLGAPEAAGALLVVYFSCGIVGVPLWFLLAGATSKHRAWCAGMSLATAGFAAAPFLGTGDIGAFVVVCIVTGLALGADVVLPPAIQADAIDVDTAASGEERSGLYFAVWALATKLALALAVGLAFPLLGYFGFDPASGQKSAAGLSALAFLYAGLPVLLKMTAIALMWNFPLRASTLLKIGSSGSS